MITLLKPINGERVSLRTNEQNTFIADENRRAFTDGSLSFQWDDLVCVGLDRSIPNPVTLSWETIYKKGLDNFGDENDLLQQKAENFIFSAGLTLDEIKIIQGLLLE